MTKHKFGSAVNCMDGRTQLPVMEYMKDKYGITWVDAITEPGPVAILARGNGGENIESIKRCLEISVDVHGSRHIVVVAHHDCAGNKADKNVQLEQTAAAVEALKRWHPQCEVVGLWIDDNWVVNEVA